MPKLNTSDKVKEQIIRVLKSLLAHVNEKSKGSDNKKSKGSARVLVAWSKDKATVPELIVHTDLKTFVDFCNDTSDEKSDDSFTKEKIKNIFFLLEEWGIWKDNRGPRQGASKWYFTLTLWSKDTAENLSRFEQEWKERKSSNKSARSTIINSDYFGIVPDLSKVYGRERELILLKQKLLSENTPCKMVGIVGIAGIGKTALACKFIEEVRAEFDYVIYWSFLNPLVPVEFLEKINNIFPENLAFSPSDREDFQFQIKKLIKILSRFHCLLFFDNIEEAIEQDTRYNEILRAIATAKHRSYTILTSRQIPESLEPLSGNRAPLYFLSLPGLDDRSGRKIFQDIDVFQGSESDWKILIQELCIGNPLFMQSIAYHIQQVHHHNISSFIRQGIFPIKNIESVFDSYFKILSTLEKSVIFELAIGREPISRSALQNRLVTGGDGESIDRAIHSLSRKIFLNKPNDFLTLHPLQTEYFTRKFIITIIDEFLTEQFEFIKRNALIKVTSPDYIRRARIHCILHPLLQNLARHLGEDRVERQLLRCLEVVRERSEDESGYVAGNTINLLKILKHFQLTEYDFSGLSIRQVYFADSKLDRINFAGARFQDCIFPQTCGSILSMSCSHRSFLAGKEYLLATGDSHGMIYFWKITEAREFELQKMFPAHGSWVWSLAFHPEGKLLASGGQDGIVKIWSITTEPSFNCRSYENFSGGHSAPIRSIAFSADGQLLATGSEDKTIKIWSVATGEYLDTLEEHLERVGGVAFSPDGQLLASGSADKTIKIWSVMTRKCLYTIGGHEDWVWQVAFSPDGQLLASGSGDRTVKIWSITERGYACRNTLKGHENWIWSVAFSPDGRYIASGSEDFTLRLWSVETGKCLRIYRGYGNCLSSVAFSPDSQYILSGSIDRSIRLWSIENSECLRQIHGHTDWICSVVFSPDGKTLVSGSGDRTIRIWSVKSGESLRVLQEKDDWTLIFQIAIAPNGQFVASPDREHRVKLWSLGTGEEFLFAPEHQNKVWALAFSPDSHLLASGSGDCSVKLWSVPRGFCVATFKEHLAWVVSVAFSPDGKLLASGSEDRTIKLWSLEGKNNRSLRTLEGHRGRVWSIAFSPNGEFLASASDDGTVKLWKLADGTIWHDLEGHKAWVWSIAFSPNGKLLASAGDDATVRLWNVETGQPSKILREHTKSVRSVCFSPDGQTLASAGEDETIKIWSVGTGDCLRSLRSPRLYEGTNITGVQGLQKGTIATIKLLGAFEESAGSEGFER